MPCPIQDDLFPVRPIDVIRNGSAKGIKLLIGTNLNEGTMLVHKENTGFPNSWEIIENMFKKKGNEEYYLKIKEYYESFGDLAFFEFTTDYAFQMPSIKIAEAQKEYDDVFMYKFNYLTKFGKESGMGAAHTFEIPLIFKDKEFEFTKMIYGNEY